MSKNKSFFQVFKPFLLISQVVGMFPVKNKIHDSKSDPVRIVMSYLSLSYIYCVFYLISMLVISIDCGLVIIEKIWLQEASKRQGSSTTQTSFGVGLILQMIMKSFIPFLAFLHGPSITRCIEQITDYDQKHPVKKEYRIWEKKYIIFLICTVLYILATISGTSSSIEAMHKNTMHRTCTTHKLFGRNSFSRFLTFFTLPQPTFEMAISIYITVINVFVTAVTERIGLMTTELRSLRINLIKPSFSNALPDNVFTIFNEQDKRFERNRRKKLSDLIERLKHLRLTWNSIRGTIEFTVLLFVSVGLCLIIFMMYIAIMSCIQINIPSVPFEKRIKFFIFFTIPVCVIGFVTSFRIFMFTESGEKLESSIQFFRDELLKVDITMLEGGDLQKIKYLQLLASSSNHFTFEFHVCDFFTLNRKFFSSIIGPVVLFVVVIAQFQLTDVTGFPGLLSMANSTLPTPILNSTEKYK